MTIPYETDDRHWQKYTHVQWIKTKIKGTSTYERIIQTFHQFSFLRLLHEHSIFHEFLMRWHCVIFLDLQNISFGNNWSLILYSIFSSAYLFISTFRLFFNNMEYSVLGNLLNYKFTELSCVGFFSSFSHSYTKIS